MNSDKSTEASAPSEAQAAESAARRLAVYGAASAFRATVKRAPKEKLYWFYSPKAKAYAEVVGDTAFVMAVLDEGDPEVVSIQYEAPTAIARVEGEVARTRFDAKTTLRSGRQQYKECKREASLKEMDERTRVQIAAQRAAASQEGADYVLVSDEALRKHIPRFIYLYALDRGSSDQCLAQFINCA